MSSALPHLRGAGDYVSVGIYPFALRLATPADLHEVRWLVDEAADWLGKNKDTDQWARPWPTREARDRRVLAGLKQGKTWIVWDGDVPAATVTIETAADPAVWSGPGCTCDPSDRAVYAHRLITARDYAGSGIGAELIDWTGLRGRRLYAARWIRVDVWTSNLALHKYYLKRGFEPCGTCPDPDYPSGVLFQKPVTAITEPNCPKFVEYQADLEATARLDRAVYRPPFLVRQQLRREAV